MRLVALDHEASVETCTDCSGRSRCCLHPHMHVSGRLRRLETATWGDKSVRLQAQSAGDVATNGHNVSAKLTLFSSLLRGGLRGGVRPPSKDQRDGVESDLELKSRKSPLFGRTIADSPTWLSAGKEVFGLRRTCGRVFDHFLQRRRWEPRRLKLRGRIFNEQLSKYGDTKSARSIMLMELKKLIEANPLFRDKLTFPPFKASRLRTLINQSSPGIDYHTAESEHLMKRIRIGQADEFIFSTAIDGKIKAWLYDCLGSRVDYDAPGRWCTTMAYSADGTSKDGDSHLVEWNETEGTIKRTYSGFRKRSLGVVQFDTTRNRFLAAGDEFMIKFWDMDNANILTTSDADGGLPVITTSDNGIKILANADGQRLVRMLESRAFDGSRGSFQLTNANVKAVMDSNRAADVKPRISEDTEKIKSWKLADVVDSAHIKALHLPDSTSTKSKVFHVLAKNLTRQFLIWLHEAFPIAVLALGSNAVHKLWKWTCNDRNPSGKVKMKLKGHQKKITGLAFSQSLNVLVSSGADAQIALGMSDGAVHVVEPPDADPNWGSAHPHDGNGAVPTISPNHALNGNQVSEPPSR
ncbi:hypothetical protein BHM03_00042060 [Ensete ventricosum]|nr:hypothetical protein BHM03_00042060 [Ensete ventricosum]